MSNYKNLTYINIQTNCNLSFSLFTIEELVNYSVTNGISNLALCEYDPYEFLRFYQLCKKSGIKPVWGFKRIINYRNQQLIINLFPRSYSEYKELNKFFYEQDKNKVIKWSSLKKIVPKCLFVLETHDYEEVFLATKLKLEILQSLDQKPTQNIYLGLNFFPGRIEVINESSMWKEFLPFFSVKSFNWGDHNLLIQLEKTSFVNGLTDVSSKSIPYLSRANLFDYFESHLEEDSTKKLFSEFFNRLFINLEIFLSKISLFVKKSSSVEKEEKFELLRLQCEEKIESLLVDDEKKSSYLKILREELQIIEKKNYASYFLELTKIVRIFLGNNIEIGPGRGSATSSLVSYLLGLTLIDPVQNGLFFWRFLNEKRTDLPDVDIDVENQEAALYLIMKEYGRQSVAKLTVKKRFGWHAAVIIGLKLFAAEQNDFNFIEENISRFLDPQKSEVSSLKINYFLEKYSNVFAFAKRIYLLYSMAVPHPSGIVISNGKLSEKLPINGEKEFPLCLYQQKYLTSFGFKKFDFLGLTESLSFIKYIKEKNLSKVPTYAELEMNDSRTWELLRNCLLVGIFQINTRSFSEIINLFQPTSFAQLLLIISLNRPGASISLREISQISSSAEMGGNRQFKSQKINEILSSTDGRIIFEEQISQILSYCLNINFAEAELIRKNLGVIINSENNKRKFKLDFISKTTGKLESFEKDLLWKGIIKSVPYLFNKAHATSYTYLTYYTAYLKANFFTDALAYLLYKNNSDYKLIISLSEEAVSMGYRLEIPDINISFWEWKVDTKIREVLIMGFSQLGKNYYSFFEKVIEERSRNGIFRDWRDLVTRLSYYFNNLKIEDLTTWVETGLFRSISGDQQLVISQLTSFKRYAKIISLLKSTSLECLPFLSLSGNYGEYSLQEENQKQWESFCFYPSYLNRWQRSSFRDLRHIRKRLFTMNNFHKFEEIEEEIKVHSILLDIKKVSGQYLLKILVFNFSFDVFCDPDLYEKNTSLLEIHNEAVFTLESRKKNFVGNFFMSEVSAFNN